MNDKKVMLVKVWSARNGEAKIEVLTGLEGAPDAYKKEGYEVGEGEFIAPELVFCPEDEE